MAKKYSNLCTKHDTRFEVDDILKPVHFKSDDMSLMKRSAKEEVLRRTGRCVNFSTEHALEEADDDIRRFCLSALAKNEPVERRFLGCGITSDRQCAFCE
jgi:hypothetical protein